MNILAYVHLRNIWRSTGAGRVARNLTEALNDVPRVSLRVLADRSDHDALPRDIGDPWATFNYALFDRETSRQQAQWLLLRRPNARDYWPEAEIIFCTAESFVPKGTARLVVTAHDAAYFERDVHPSDLTTWKQRWKWQRLYAVLAAQADVIHTVSAFSAERLAHFHPALRSRLRVVYNGVTPRFFEEPTVDSHDVLRRHGLEGRRYIHVPGGLSFRKNAKMILHTWPLVARDAPDVLLAISGHVDSTYRAATERLGPSVRLLGFTTDEELKRLYHDAQLTWFASRYEGFGIPILESMACGTPVIASNVAAIPEIAYNHALLVPPDDVEAHRSAILELLGDSRRRSEMSREGVVHAREFTWARAARELHQCFEALV